MMSECEDAPRAGEKAECTVGEVQVKSSHGRSSDDSCQSGNHHHHQQQQQVRVAVVESSTISDSIDDVQFRAVCRFVATTTRL